MAFYCRHTRILNQAKVAARHWHCTNNLPQIPNSNIIKSLDNNVHNIIHVNTQKPAFGSFHYQWLRDV